MSDASLNVNRGRATRQVLPTPRFPNADDAVRAQMEARPATAVDILFVNPPAPDRGIWIRSQHRVGRRSREGQIWPQVDLAQMAALFPDMRVDIVDAIPLRMTWEAFEALLVEKRPRYYVTQVTAPTLQNDMYGVFLAKSLGATTLAFGTHVTPIPRETMRAYPALDYILLGEPELTLVEIVEALESHNRQSPIANRQSIPGLVWRDGNDIVINPPRPFIENLDELPLPRHDLLPLQRYRAPLVGGPYAFIVPSRGCPAQCRFCIKHVSYGHSVRFRSPENVLAEIEQLVGLGVRKIHMYADLFTVNRDHVLGICQGLLDRGIKIRWTCNSRVDFVDPELLQTMARSGCWMISWGIESADPAMLERMNKGITPADVERALRWSKEAGIMNWGYFIIGLPGETEASIRKTIAFAKKLPLDIALFHIAAPHPGTPFFFEVIENGWFRPGTRWEEVDMDRSTVLDYPNLKAEDLERWAKRAFREWALRPGPMWTYLKMLATSPSLWRAALEIGLESLGWARGD
ncbi:MAG TPA: radical SAM protein [Anaerolineae bacterium]|nr:radical SAM protein [Anaerolineae bacterium]HQK13191.1 radical SAM protein [Anaerolineae bacterium]